MWGRKVCLSWDKVRVACRKCGEERCVSAGTRSGWAVGSVGKKGVSQLGQGEGGL